MAIDDSQRLTVPPSVGRLIDQVRDRFEAAWKSDQRPRIEDFLGGTVGLERKAALGELLLIEIKFREQLGHRPARDEYAIRFPNDVALVESVFRQTEPSRVTEVSGNAVVADSSDKVLSSYDQGTVAFTPGGPSPLDGAGSPRHVTITRLDTPPGEHTRYTITRLYAEGGLGKVWLAADRDLNRDVVLKEIRPKQARNPEQLRRFVKEAQVTGQLEHPNIVPIYEMGWRADGHPFYTMRFVRGHTLRDLIKQYHDHRHRGTLNPLELPRLLGIFVSVCNAVAYAHSRGVIHRDLKPANIAVGEFGEVVVLDWGLAKIMDQPDEASVPIDVAPVASADATVAGDVMGTPGYMAPEQARGDTQQTNARADIYGLGAILYTILVGRPPHHGKNTVELLELIVRGDVPTARSVDPTVPPALSAICATATALVPADRYASVRDLALDIDRYLADEPVTVYREPWWRRTRRWTRKHRTVCLMGAAVAVVLAIAFGLWNVWDAHRVAQLRTEARSFIRLGQVALSENALVEAKRKFSQALAAIGDEPTLADLMIDAQRLHEQAEARLMEQADRDTVQRNLARFAELRNRALFHGTLFTGIDLAANVEAARSAAEEGLTLFAVDPAASGFRLLDKRYLTADERNQIRSGSYELLLVLADAAAHALPGTDSNSQQAKKSLGILAGAAKLGLKTRAYHLRKAQYLEQAGDIQGAKREQQIASEVEPSTALDHFLVGDTLYKLGDLATASEHFERALRMQPEHFWARYFLAVCHLKQDRPREAVAHLTASLSLQPKFGWTWLVRGYAYGQLNDFASAEADFQRARQLGVDDYGFYVNRGAVRIRSGNFEGAVTDLQRAVKRRPEQYEAYVNLAEIHRRRGELDLALAQLKAAIRRAGDVPTPYRVRAQVRLQRDDLQGALADYDAAVRYGMPDSRSLATDHLERGRILHRLGRNEQALAAYDAAGEMDPDDRQIHYLRADALLALKRDGEALAALDRYLEPKSPEPQAYRLRGFERSRRGDAAGALADYTRALELEPDSSLARGRRGWAYLNSAAQLALADFDQAIKLDPNNSDLYNGRGYARVLVGKYLEAVEDAEAALQRGPVGAELKERLALFQNAACIYAQAAGRAALDMSVAGQPDLTKGYQFRAIELLRSALELLPPGLRGNWFQSTAADPAFDPVRHTDDFKKLAETYPPP